MTLDGYHVDVMRSKTWACWIFFVGYILSLGVARECISFENYIANVLLKDHWFQIQKFQHPDETVKEGYTLLSIIDMLCTSLNKYGKLDDSNTSPFENYREKVKWSYRHLVNKSLNLTDKDNTLKACEKHVCNFSFSTSYIGLDQLSEMYNRVCKWNGSLPACPSNTSHSPLQVNRTTSTLSPTYPLTSTPSHITSHQSTSPTSSSSQPQNMTISKISPSPSNNTETPTACQPTSSNNSTDNISKNEKLTDEKSKDENVLLLLLLTVSCTVNVALLIVVWWQCRNRNQKNLPDYSEEYQHYQNYVELVYMRSAEQNSSDDNHHTSEFTCLQHRGQSEDNAISSSPAT